MGWMIILLSATVAKIKNELILVYYAHVKSSNVFGLVSLSFTK